MIRDQGVWNLSSGGSWMVFTCSHLYYGKMTGINVKLDWKVDAKGYIASQLQWSGWRVHTPLGLNPVSLLSAFTALVMSPILTFMTHLNHLFSGLCPSLSCMLPEHSPGTGGARHSSVSWLGMGCPSHLLQGSWGLSLNKCP